VLSELFCVEWAGERPGNKLRVQFPPQSKARDVASDVRRVFIWRRQMVIAQERSKVVPTRLSLFGVRKHDQMRMD
jgi:hypothetical protein